MNNVIMRTIVLTADYQPLAAGGVVGSFVISASPGNDAAVTFLGDTNDDVPWVPGEWHEFRGVDLAQIRAKGTPGDILTVVGGTW